MSADRPTAIALIPARGGSKRIARKNVRPFAGLPLIAHSIRTALRSGVFARVIVSSDDAEIQRVAREHGAEAPFTRPDDLSDDHATTEQVIHHALDWLEEHTGEVPANICCLYATAPLLSAESLRQGLERLDAIGATTALSVTTFPFPPQRALRQGEHERLAMLHPEHRKTRSQDLEELWHDAGQFYWLDVARFRSCGTLYNDDMIGVVLPRHRVQDIDTLEDWKRAELLHALIQQEDAE